MYLNPLEIGSNCNGIQELNGIILFNISIPLKSGLIVIIERTSTFGLMMCYLNPLEIGSNCNGVEMKNVLVENESQSP